MSAFTPIPPATRRRSSVSRLRLALVLLATAGGVSTLLGHAAGDVVEVERPGGAVELTVVEVRRSPP